MKDVEVKGVFSYKEMENDFGSYLETMACFVAEDNKLISYDGTYFFIEIYYKWGSYIEPIVCKVPKKFIKKINLTPRTINIL